ncbi:MAG: glycosyltransferase [Actinomycetota bacterium]|nr:glycosyltransferase [Actinomycetota bacterium]
MADHLRASVVVITRNRRDELLRSLRRLERLPDRAETIVVDNDSSDGTLDAVRRAFPDIRLIRLDRNLGAVARTVGVRAASSPVVAFADDDSWWAPGSLDRAASHFDRHGDLALICARIVVEPQGTVDRACLKMATAPIGRGAHSPGPRILGHLACGTVVRRSAYLEVGGYSELIHFGGEERLLSLDLAVAGWEQCYVEDVVAHHQPSPVREDWPTRWALYRRNDTLTAWMRLPLRRALAETGQLVADAVREETARRELSRFARLLWPAWRERRPVERHLVTDLADHLRGR